jgi:hypothetical protein
MPELEKPRCRYKVPNPDYRSVHRWICSVLKKIGPGSLCPTCILYKPEEVKKEAHV